MKRIFKSIMFIAVAAMTLYSCSKESTETPEVPEENGMVTLKFNIKNADKTNITKALLGSENGKNFLKWENGDKIGTFSTGTFSEDHASNNNPGTVAVNGDNYTLNVQTYNAGSITNIYSYFPHSASAGKNKAAAIVTIPESQTMNANGFDADAMPMAGEPVSVSITTEAANTDTPCGTINFSNLGSIIKFRIYSSTATEETLTSVKYVTSGNVGGAFSIDLTRIDSDDETTLALTASDPVSTITTNYQTKPVIGNGKDNAIDVYMVVAPGTYANTQVIVTTNAHTYTLTASGAKTYTRSHVKPMNVDIQNGVVGDLPQPETWTKVTNAADFTAGTYYILRGDGAYYLPNAIASSGAPACASFTIGGDISNAMKWTATEGEDGLIFESVSHSGYYLWGWNTSNGIRITTTSPATGASKEWTFASLDVSGTTYYTAYAVSNRYLISYGSQDWRNYTSASATNIPAEFYKLDDGRASAGLSYAISSYQVNAGETFATPTLTNPHNLTVTYSSSDDNLAVVDENTGEVLIGDDPGTVTITASFAGNATYKPGSASYTITIYVPAFTTVAGLNAKATDTAKEYTGTLTNAVVSFVPDLNNAIIKDATGSVLVYKSGHGLLQGQTLTGDITATVKLYNSCTEITAFTASFTGSTTVVSPEVVTLSQLVGHLNEYQNAYVQVAELTVTGINSSNISVQNGSYTYVVYAKNGVPTGLKAGDIITVKGTIAHYGSDDQIVLWSTNDCTVTGQVTIPSHTITFSQPLTGGSFVVKVGDDEIASGDEVQEGQTVTLTANPSSGYAFSSWTVTGATVSGNTTSPATFVVGSNDVSIAASFVASALTSVTFDYPTLYSTVTSGSQSLDGLSDVVGGVTIAYAKVSGSNPPQYYANGTNLRIYNESTMTITAPTGKKIKTIDFSQGTTTWASGKMAGDSGTVNDSNKKWTNETGANSVILTITGSFRFTKIVVSYE